MALRLLCQQPEGTLGGLSPVDEDEEVRRRAGLGFAGSGLLRQHRHGLGQALLRRG
jgi:hypothetical protein